MIEKISELVEANKVLEREITLLIKKYVSETNRFPDIKIQKVKIEVGGQASEYYDIVVNTIL